MALLIASGNSYIPELSVFCITVYVFCSHSFSGEADSPAEIAADTFMATAKAPSAPDDSGVSQNALTAAKSEQDWRVASLRAVHYIHFYVQHVECETNITFRAEFVKKTSHSRTKNITKLKSVQRELQKGYTDESSGSFKPWPQDVLHTSLETLKWEHAMHALQNITSPLTIT